MSNAKLTSSFEIDEHFTITRKSWPTEPVTDDGWYVNSDGSVTEWVWEAGQLLEGPTVKNWETVPLYKAALSEYFESI